MAKLLTGTRIYGTANVDSVLRVGNTTPVNSTSNTTGSIVVTGGVGITGNVYTGNIVITGTTSNGITFADGTRQTTAATGGGGGGASPSGYLANTIIVANSTGFLSNSNAFFTQSNSTIIFDRSSPVLIQNTTSSVSTTTGALVVSGGLGVSDYVSAQYGLRFGAGILQSTNMTFGNGNYGGANWTSVYDPASYGGIKTNTSSHSLVGGGLNNGTLWFNQFVSPTLTSVNAPTNGNVATVLIGSPIINAANTFLANVVPYSLWANGSIYTANNVTVANSVIVSRGVEIISSVLANNVVTSSASVVVNDITNQFDNLNCVFNLRSDQSNVVSILNSRNLEVIVNGAKLAPYVGELRFPWLTPYDSFKGYRVVSSNTRSQVVIYNPPAPGDQAILTLINNSSSPQNRRYPYSAATIALGD
jgi:hypothetical protein